MTIDFKFGKHKQDTNVQFKMSHNAKQRHQDGITMQKLNLLSQYTHQSIPEATWKHVYHELFK